MKVYAGQWIGSRHRQEDVYRVKYYPDGVLMVVCDGMGGHHQGALSAATAADVFMEVFEEEEDLPITERLREALDEANDAVGRLFEGSDGYGGTTLVAAFVGSGVMRWISVGDSCALLWRAGRLLRLNEDHSMRPIVEQMLAMNQRMGNDLPIMGNVHLLRSAVTGEEMEMVDAPMTPYPLLPSDVILLCSDGVEHVLAPGNVSPQVAEILNHPGEGMVGALLSACQGVSEPNPDNTTIVALVLE